MVRNRSIAAVKDTHVKCVKNFPWKSALTIHERVHTGDHIDVIIVK